MALLFALVVVSSPATSTAWGGASQKARSAKKPQPRITREQLREVETTLSELGYWTGPVDGSIDDCTRQAIIAFEKVEKREITGKVSLELVGAILASSPPEPLESDYEHVEVDIARQVLYFVSADGEVSHATPVSTGNNEVFRMYGEPNRAYTPRGRFTVYAKGTGWQESPLGLLYYPSYLIGGIAIHGNPAVPPKPDSHGCIRVPMCFAREMATMLPVGTKVVIHDAGSLANGLLPWPDDEAPETEVLDR